MDDGRDILSKWQRWMSTGVSVAIAFIVMAVFGSLLWGIMAFLISTVVVNLALLRIKDMRGGR